MVESGAGGGAGLALPFAPKTAFGTTRAPVQVSIDGGPPFATTVAVYGGRAWIGLRKAQLTGLDLTVGDRVDLVVELDTAPRTVDLPAELAATFAADDTARQRYDALSFTNRKEYARWVGDAKRETTRTDRAAKAGQLLVAGIKTPG